MKNIRLFSRFIFAAALSLLVSACAHQINISPLSTPSRDEAKLINKNVVYVMTNEMRNKSVTTNGGGGDKVTYSPYRDLEKAIRDALRSVYRDVTVVGTTNPSSTGSASNISLFFKPEITTSSSSDSVFTWPPTQFFINLECAVMDSEGKLITTIRLSGNGGAEFSEFKSDFGLAGRRAATDLGSKLTNELLSHPELK